MRGRKTDPDPSQATIALIGAGGLARALAPALVRSGSRLVLASRRPESARALLRGLHSRLARAVAEPAQAAAQATLLVLCVPDDELEGLATELAQTGSGKGRCVLHASGFQSERVLAPLARAGWSTGSLHPLLALPRRGRAASFEGAWFAIAGQARACRAARGLVRALGGRELALRAGAQAEYHLAATLVSNGSLALFELARAHFERAVLRPREAREAFAALLAATAANLAHASPRDSLTGPLARGDERVLRGHLELLTVRGERELYRALGRVLLDLSSDRLTPAQRRKLAALLSPSRTR
ncbi:MAG: DUF2520 domain-containing protein [Planctomycetes bacterium]|nr:DUF2520 domain-containing protein [Planctomycetota bacterium]